MRIDWLKSPDGTECLNWNPVHLRTIQTNQSWWCEKISPGCDWCYASQDAARWYGTPYPYFLERQDVAFSDGQSPGLYLSEYAMRLPLSWQKSYRVLLGSMTDILHPAYDRWRERIFDVIRATPRHIYIIVTKRVDQLLVLDRALDFWPENVITCCSIESKSYEWRISQLEKVRSYTRGLFIEPLLSHVDLSRITRDADGSRIHWVVVGGEIFGPPERQLVWHHNGILQPKPEALTWVRSIRDQCHDLGISFLFKGWGGKTPRVAGRILDGRIHQGFAPRIELVHA